MTLGRSVSLLRAHAQTGCGLENFRGLCQPWQSGHRPSFIEARFRGSRSFYEVSSLLCQEEKDRMRGLPHVETRQLIQDHKAANWDSWRDHLLGPSHFMDEETEQRGQVILLKSHSYTPSTLDVEPAFNAEYGAHSKNSPTASGIGRRIKGNEHLLNTVCEKLP